MCQRSSVLLGRYGVGSFCMLVACLAMPNQTARHLQKAKLHHPDVSHKRKDSRHFARILVAYQVLSNARQRQLYDLSLKSSSSPIHDAAQQGSRYCSNSQGRLMHLYSTIESIIQLQTKRQCHRANGRRMGARSWLVCLGHQNP